MLEGMGKEIITKEHASPSRRLRSSSKNLMFTPLFNLKTYGARSFSVAAPTLWNALPSEIRNSSSVFSFKNKLS